MTTLPINSGPTAVLPESLATHINATLQRYLAEGVVGRIFAHDPSLWKPGDEGHAKSIRNRLGWLTSVEDMQAAEFELRSFVGEVQGDGYTDAVLLGMGGSSLAPEVFAETFGISPGFLRLHVLDTTAPDVVAAVRQSLDLSKTLFLVSSKSGGTIETSSLHQYFWKEAITVLGQDEAPRHFVAITDPGSPLEKQATQDGFRRVFTNDPTIGGRYSALSYFGVVPAALIGVELAPFLNRAQAVLDSMRGTKVNDSERALTSPLWLGVILGEAAHAGRDKLTLLLPPAIGSFGYWVEQLVAESIGKEGKGILPVEGEPLATTLDAQAPYGDDRLFVYIQVEEAPDAATEAAAQALAMAGYPVVRLWLKDVYDLGGEMWRWEFATAVAGIALGINPFDEPNVSESKKNTGRLLDVYQQQGALPNEAPALTANGIAVFGRDVQGGSDLKSALHGFLDNLEAGDYLAIMAYTPRTPAIQHALDQMRQAVRDRYAVATVSGYGPRFLHSTGQLHKGGPAIGHFLQITTDPQGDVDIPGAPYSFATLINAQALGDLEALNSRDYPVLRLHITGNVEAGLQHIAQAMQQAASA